MNLKETYNHIAQDWHNDHKKDDWWIEGTNAFAGLLPSNARVLDVGCASGVKTRYLMDKGFRVLGIDFSEKLIEIAKTEVPEGEFRVMDMHDVSSLPEIFDGIFAQASLLHIQKKDAEAVIAGFVDRLTPGGHLYVAVKGVRDGKPEEDVVAENDYGYPYERFFSFYTLDELKGYFQNVGLDMVYENTSIGKSRWLQIIGKKK